MSKQRPVSEIVEEKTEEIVELAKALVMADSIQESAIATMNFRKGVTKIIQAERQASERAVRERDEYKKELMWLINESWELCNKPWRFFSSLGKTVNKYGNVACTTDFKNKSQDAEALVIIEKWKDWVGTIGDKPTLTTPVEEHLPDRPINSERE